jgi:nucleotide-binding universal stress UspA family protein
MASATLAAAGEILGRHAQIRRIYGLTVPELLNEARRTKATLLAIGSHGHPRLEEILFGGIAGELLHQAPCSVLVARPVPDLETFPRSIVVGLDGSPESELAFSIACDLARRSHGSLEGLVATGGKHVDTGLVFYRHSFATHSEAPPVKALVDASATADLVIVGSRGLHGIRALGSVSERIAHQASCSVLVVRDPADGSVAVEGRLSRARARKRESTCSPRSRICPSPSSTPRASREPAPSRSS